MPEFNERDDDSRREHFSKPRYDGPPDRDYHHYHNRERFRPYAPRPYGWGYRGSRPYYPRGGRFGGGFRGRFHGGDRGGYDPRRRYNRSRSRSPTGHRYERRERVIDVNVVPKYASDTGGPDDPLILDIPDFLSELKRRSAVRRNALTKEYDVDKYETAVAMCNSSFPRQERNVRDVVDEFLEQSNPWKFPSLDSEGKKLVTISGVVTEKGGDGSEAGNDLNVSTEKANSDNEDESPRRKFNPSLKPSNDYSQHYVDSDLRPQNFVHDSGYDNRFREYPKLRELLYLKDDLVNSTNTPPMYMNCDFEKFNLKKLRSVFDVIMISAPLVNGYSPESSDPKLKQWTFDELSRLDIEAISSSRGFIFMWCGTSENVDDCRECIHSWNYRRCEDICWIKTNSLNRDTPRRFEPETLFHRTKEHCLVGIRGTVKRNQDGDFIHANTDLDLILSEEPEFLSHEKPEEIFKIIQHFCLGRRRLHLFGSDRDIRPGWLTIGPNITGNNFDPVKYASWFSKEPDGKSIPDGHLTGCSDRIEEIRPKSPPVHRLVENSDYKDPIPNTL
ncbi:N(6)-adenosine-methyltransferase non-catalytic subunit METTL14-like [Convolutriloba macropyga]|uniref:N(6)-adenosine-methyltransferase non-catalytic subunit METTL14-like n=1 Tax=Convolutriloba macropyga TaxID=536237 RepID=UPI003F5216FB